LAFGRNLNTSPSVFTGIASGECRNPGDDSHLRVKLNLCSAKKRDFDVYAGKTKVATNKNVKFYSFF